MPPIHPAIIHYPIALIVCSFIAELLGYIRKSTLLRGAGGFTLAGALIGAILAILAGYYDMGRAHLAETHDYVHVHLIIGWALFALLSALALWRWRISRSGKSAGTAYLALAACASLLTLFQAWYGGEMVYSQGAGVAAAGKGVEPPDAGLARLKAIPLAGPQCQSQS